MNYVTLQNIYQAIRQSLRQAGIETSGLDTRLILKSVLGISDADLISDSGRVVSESDVGVIESLVQRRLVGEPVSKMLGEKEFWSLLFKVTKDVLDPRPDTETLVEAALKRFGTTPPQAILDLGTGSGCLLIALLHEWSDAHGVGVDISEAALRVARENAGTHGVANRIRFVQGNWGHDVAESFDLIVANPPYIPSREIATLSKDVKNYDPIQALDGGEDGLDAYKTIITEIKTLLKKGGTALFEIGGEQENDVVRLVEESGLSVRDVHADLAGIPRVVEISYGDK